MIRGIFRSAGEILLRRAADHREIARNTRRSAARLSLWRHAGGELMHLKLFAAAGAAAFLLFAPARADAACCDQKMMPC